MIKKLIYFFTWKSKLLKQLVNHNLEWQPILSERQASDQKLTESQLQKIGRAIFEKILVKHLTDLKLTSEEMDDLAKLADYCKIDREKITKIKAKYAPKSIQTLSMAMISDNILTAEEKAEMYDLAAKLEISKDIVDKANNTNALKAYQAALNSAISDRRLSDEEENELKKLVENLGVADEAIKKETGKIDLAYFKLLHNVENGNLPEIASKELPLQKNEICHYITKATKLENKVVTVGHTGGSRGVSLRVMKGVSYRVGNFRSEPIKKEVTFRFPGTLTITSKRIIFTAVKKGFSIPIGKLTNFEPFADGAGLQKDSQYHLMQFEGRQTELVGLIITAAVNKL